MNEEGQTLERENHVQRAKHAKLPSSLLPALKSEPFIVLDSQQRLLYFCYPLYPIARDNYTVSNEGFMTHVTAITFKSNREKRSSHASQ